MRPIGFCTVILALLAAPVWAIDGSALPLNSGFTSGSSAQLNNNGYAGTYIRLDTPGDVSITVNASGTAFDGVDPQMNIVIADSKAPFDVATSGSNSYTHVFQNMPAGTYFVRTEFPNDGGTDRTLSIDSFAVTGATMLNSTDNNSLRANALAAADTYIDHFRQGPGKVALVGAAPGSEVHVKLKNPAFHWGTNIHGVSDTGLINPNPAPGSTAQKYQDFVIQNFNMVEGSNAGKWSVNEGSRDNVSLSWQDKIFAFAEAHGMDARMHAMVWGTQQPNWVTSMLTNFTSTDTYSGFSNPQGTNLTNSDALFSDQLAPPGTPNAGEPSEINERVQYYVADRAQRYSELDVYNESYHTGVNGGDNSIWNRYGPEGVAKIYDAAAEAAESAGADVNIYTNEYGVLEGQGGDDYANWYRENIEAIEQGDGDPFDQTVSGIGIQYYSHNGHDPDTMMKALQNLMVLGLPITLTEFGVQGQVASEEDRIRNVVEAHRMIFGTPNATGFLYWGWWASATDPNLQGAGVLVDADFNLTPVGEAWKALRDRWNNDETVVVADDGTIDFTGFFGDYEITVNGQTYDLALSKGEPFYSLVIAPGDYNGDGIVNAADYVTWRMAADAEGDLRADGNGDKVVDEHDYEVWRSAFGTVYSSGSGSRSNRSAAVPEPATGWMVLLGCSVLAFHSGARRDLLNTSLFPGSA
jgi:GH35 family endo-1,4-beta-xylanase